MPSTPLFDISGIRTNDPIMGRQDIAAWIPHRGPIFMLDAVLWIDDAPNRALAVSNIPDNPWWADGHIPGHPLMPGVLQVEAAAQLSSLLYHMRSGKNWFAGFTRINDVAFRGQVRPGDDLFLLCSAVKYSLKRFVTDVQAVVNDAIVMEGQIAGMAFPRMGDDIQRTPLQPDDLSHQAS
jgi:3-hydroxyacyl-[acyl-carrier-protein] dehydratase